MTRCFYLLVVLAVPACCSAAGFAQAVVDYAPGVAPARNFPDDLPYTQPNAAIGWPERVTADGTNFEGVVSPFNPPAGLDEIVSIGEGGFVTLRLSNYAVPVDGPELGFFTNAGLGDQDYPAGLAATDLSQPFTTFGIDSAMVEVSEDGAAWVSLGVQVFDIPANPFLDLASPFSATPGAVLADPGLPFDGALSSFAGKNYAEIKTLLGGSAGGTWLDISGAGLPRVGYVRLSVPTGGGSFELDAVSVATAALGAPVPEPGALALAVAAAGCLAAVRRR
ncbi:hypothetical protein Pla175_04230 [Pirellulimonas nuda]|uniref:PEP-CTERM protein-sorting domain-containing protein n=1 Tax=Pirellulimonas nuda TaxID=2528009 RepID=A0A518D6F8_9BACT|nr:hypothetical protein [Pirellulimonas nuda]QDU87068.1 hypothetical protein Pla175_04230 [Pirellulimonas nuda]